MLWEGVSVAVACLITIVIIGLLTSPARRVAWLGQEKYFGWEALRPEHISQSARGLSPQLLALMRLCFAAVICWTSYDQVVRAPIRTGRGGTMSLSTFTFWCWSFQGLYFLGVGVASVSHCLGCDTADKASEKPAGTVACGLWVLYQVMFGAAFLTFCSVWLLLIPTEYAAGGWESAKIYFTLNMLAAHNLNVVFMLLEAAMNRLTFRRPFVLLLWLYGLMYIIFSWCLFGAIGVFNYFFLDWRNEATPAWYVGLFIVSDVFFRVARWCSEVLKSGVPSNMLLGGEKAEESSLSVPETAYS